MAASLFQQATESEFSILTNSEAHFLEVIKFNKYLNILIDFDGGIKLAEMLFRTNIIGFVGTGDNTSYPATRLILWDDIQHRPFGELNFKNEVLNIKLRKDKVVVVLLEKIYVYNF